MQVLGSKKYKALDKSMAEGLTFVPADKVKFIIDVDIMQGTMLKVSIPAGGYIVSRNQDYSMYNEEFSVKADLFIAIDEGLDSIEFSSGTKVEIPGEPSASDGGSKPSYNTEVLMAEQSVNGDNAILEDMENVNPPDTILVTFDGIGHVCPLWYDPYGDIAYGNGSFIEDAEHSNDMPFIISTYLDTPWGSYTDVRVWNLSTADGATHTIKIERILGENGSNSAITLQDKEITENGTYTADEGFDGLGTVNVNVASSGGNNEDLEQWINFIERGFNQYVTKLPNGLTRIGMYAFQDDSRITIEEIPEGVTFIDYYAFAECTIKAMTFPNSLEEIGFNAFQKCTSLKEITFKGKPNTINSAAFDSCTNIAKINVPWAEGEVANAPWGATKAVINYNYTGE